VQLAVVGHRTATGWLLDSSKTIRVQSDYQMKVVLHGGAATLWLDGAEQVNYQFNSTLTQNPLGLFSRTNGSTFDNVVVRGDDPGAQPALADAREAATAIDRTLTYDELNPIAAEAIRRWTVTAEHAVSLHEVSFVIADLAGSTLGLAVDRFVLIDQTAAGYGWFADLTPALDEEFDHDAEGVLVAGAGSPAYGRVDLLTVVMHELGHVLDLEHTDEEEGHDHDLMGATLGTGVRLLPEHHDHADQASEILTTAAATEAATGHSSFSEAAPPAASPRAELSIGLPLLETPLGGTFTISTVERPGARSAAAHSVAVDRVHSTSANDPAGEWEEDLFPRRDDEEVVDALSALFASDNAEDELWRRWA
jgi:hypothetical protein